MAWLNKNITSASVDEIGALLAKMHSAVRRLGEPVSQQAESSPTYVPAVSVRASLASPDHIISLIDGRPYRTLRRHLALNDLTPDEYRQRYRLDADYPMNAPTFSDTRRAAMKTIGLGPRSRHLLAEDSMTDGGDADA